MPPMLALLGYFIVRDSIAYTLSVLCYRQSVCPSVTGVGHTKTVETRIMKSCHTVAPSL